MKNRPLTTHQKSTLLKMKPLEAHPSSEITRLAGKGGGRLIGSMAMRGLIVHVGVHHVQLTDKGVLLRIKLRKDGWEVRGNPPKARPDFQKGNRLAQARRKAEPVKSAKPAAKRSARAKLRGKASKPAKRTLSQDAKRAKSRFGVGSLRPGPNGDE